MFHRPDMLAVVLEKYTSICTIIRKDTGMISFKL